VSQDCRKNVLRARVQGVLKVIKGGIRVGVLLSLGLMGFGIYGFIINYDPQKSWSDLAKQIFSTIALYGICASGVPVGGWLWMRLLRMKYAFVLEDTEGNCATHETPTPDCAKQVSTLEGLLQSPLKM
jgi:hypothetical protein